ncbi:hypothetical protein FACS1894168_4190 [Deltaproteobacteria bacterium]|nr:hypothetical protein FACS1894168_4190 [Deltaproteobacteria bacterium]
MNAIIDSLRRELPPTFTRATAVKMMGGLFTAGTLANLDCLGKGPGGALIGRKMVYEREAFVAWLESRMGDGEFGDD